MTGRKCSTCKHYEPAPIWRKGWCRNPLLFSPQQSHLVGEDDLDCERGMGNYWEPADAAQSYVDVDAAGFREQVSDAFATVAPSQTPTMPPNVSSAPMAPPAYAFAVSGGSVGDPPGDEPPLPGGGGGGRGGRDRQISYYSDDRYWTDYLRIAAPILGVLLMVALFWFWASSFLGDNNNKPNTGGVSSTQTSLPTIGAGSPRSGSPTHVAQGSPTLTIVRTPAAATATAGGDEQPTEDTGDQGDNTPPASSDIYSGANVVVANTGGTGANMRSDASASADVVAVEADGTQLEVTGDSVEADGYVWWPVSGDDGAGFIVADYLQLAQ
jgi:hypothetical protein